MAMDTVAMVSYIYYGKSVVQVLSLRGKFLALVLVFGIEYALLLLWRDSGLGLNMNNARRALFNNGI